MNKRNFLKSLGLIGGGLIMPFKAAWASPPIKYARNKIAKLYAVFEENPENIIRGETKDFTFEVSSKTDRLKIWKKESEI